MPSDGDVRSIKLTLAYDGGGYHGWQRQPNLKTVQGTLEQALARVADEPIQTLGAGRTDAGVHALGQVAGFSTAAARPVEAYQRGANAYLPGDLRVVHAEEAPSGFDPIGDAVGKRYRYTFGDGATHDVFSRRYRWHVPTPLDVAAMTAAARVLLGKHDFSSFENAGSPRQDAVRSLHAVSVQRCRGGDPHRVDVDVVGDGFLYNMVRNIAGSLYEVGRGARDADWLAAALAAEDRAAAGPTAPPHGLALVEVFYTEQRWRESLSESETRAGQGGGGGA